jgi:hypothetical protein
MIPLIIECLNTVGHFYKYYIKKLSINFEFLLHKIKKIKKYLNKIYHPLKISSSKIPHVFVNV